MCLTVVFCFVYLPEGFAYSQCLEFLCEIGISFYRQGRYEEALHEFNKALLLQPNYEPALKYAEITQRMLSALPEEQVVKLPSGAVFKGSQSKKANEYLGVIDLQKEVIREKRTETQPIGPVPSPVKKRAYTPKTLLLNESFSSIQQPIELEQGENIIIKGTNIQRFLITQPETLTAQRLGADEISFSGKGLGYTFAHIWDDNGRWSMEFLTVPPKPQGPTLEEELRMKEEEAGNFRLRYDLDWSSFLTGKKLETLERTNYAWRHALSLNGETPYGLLDSTVAGSVLHDTREINYITLGLTQGKLGSFKDFDLRVFDYTPLFGNLVFGGGNLRGAIFDSPMFNHKFDYALFWGREEGGLYGGFTSQSRVEKKAYLGGADFNFDPDPKQNYGLSIVRGWGKERQADLPDYGYDANFSYDLKRANFSGDLAYDSNKTAYLLSSYYSVPKFNLHSELRNIDKEFNSMYGLAARAGELGVLNNLYYSPFSTLNFDARLDVYKDRLFPNPKNPAALNEDLDLDANLNLDPNTTLRFDYLFQNDLGKISPIRSLAAGAGISRNFDWIRRISTFLTYRYVTNRNFSSPTLDYINNRIFTGLSFYLVKDLNYFMNEELGRVEARNSNDSANPRVFQTGVDWYKQVFTTPFYVNLRLMYRDEENADSQFSFLSGEDYIEGYADLSYRPKPDIEAFFNSRVRNVWAENPNTQKHIDIDFYSGLRYLWDTGIRWESEGSVEGYVFKDYNSDGLRQRDEPPIEGVKVWLGKDKSQVTDLFGYYKFRKVRARKAFISIDSGSMPPGFILTVPATQEAPIAQSRTVEINFGLLSKTEVSGVVFEDAAGNKQLGFDSTGIKGVQMFLEDGNKVTTDDSGRYSFRKVSLGKHRLNLDLKTVPTEYIPSVPIFIDFELSEGQSFNYNIPLKKNR